MSQKGLTRRYALFISYRHADNLEQGRKWATWLHEAVENYEIPPDLIGKNNLREEPIPSSLYPVFRDEEELPADADLSTNIRRALDHSSLLVVICSPRAVQSRFVADEIRYFKEIGKSGRILALMIDGEPNASDDPEKLARLGGDTECFPEPLRFGVPREDGTIDWSARTEPIAADCRPGGHPAQGWTTAAAYEEQLQHEGTLSRADREAAVKDYAERLELARLKVIAGALGIPLGELTQRDKARQLVRARKRARVLAGLSVVFAGLAGAAALLGWIANKERKAADEARNVADAEKQRAVETLAASDFLEGTTRLAKPATARSGLSYLARSARAGHQAAVGRIWTLWQQESFWVPSQNPPDSVISPEKPHLQPANVPPLFATVTPEGEPVAPTWYAESPDGKRCVTIVSASLAGEGPLAFRVWTTAGEPLTGWLAIDYRGENYLSTIDSAIFSDDGRFLAVLATPWRAPQFVQIWDVNEGQPLGEPISAGGGHPNYQGGAFNDVWFSPHLPSAIGPLLVTLSNRGSASVYRIDASDEPSLWLAFTNEHDQPVNRGIIDPELQIFVSAAVDGTVHIANLGVEKSVGWPVKIEGTAAALRINNDREFSVLLENGGVRTWELVGPTPAPLPAQTKLESGKDNDLQRQWDSDEKSTGAAVVLDQRNGKELRSSGRKVELIDTATPGALRLWEHQFPAPVVIARFIDDTQVLIQTSFFTTE